LMCSTEGVAISGCADRESLPGAEDDVRIYNRALVATEIKQLYVACR